MQRVHTKTVFDIESGLILEDEFELYLGPWTLLKESSAEKARRQRMEDLQFKAAESYYNVDLPWQRNMAQQQMSMYNRQAAAEEAFQREYLGMQRNQFDTMTKLWQDQIAKQEAAIKPVREAMTPYLKGDIGFDETTRRLMLDETMSDIAGGYGDAAGNLQAQILSRGGDAGLGGPQIGQLAELQAGLANEISGGRRTINLENARQMLLNQFNAGNTLMGVGGQNVSLAGAGIGGSGSAAAGFGAGAQGFANPPVVGAPGAPAMLAPPKPQGGGFWGNLGRGLLGIGTTALGGGIGNLFSSWFKKNPTYQPMMGVGVYG